MHSPSLSSLAIGLFYGASLWILAPVVLLWGFFVVADSAQFSAMVTELSPPHAVGTALTLQTSLGFLLTMVTIQMIPVLVEVAGWRLAFPVLALGPAAGIAAIRRLGYGSRSRVASNTDVSTWAFPRKAPPVSTYLRTGLSLHILAAMNVRDQLLVAAAQVYAEGGYHGATTRRIASAAGVNEITLFRHFGSKDVLLREALARCQGEGEMPLPEEPADPLRELTEWCRSHLHDLQARAPLIRTCLSEFAERPGLVAPEISCPVRAASALTGYLERLKQHQLASASFDERVAAAMLMGVLFADAVGRDIVPDMYANEPEDALTEYVALFLRGIGVETSAKRSSA